MYIIAMHVLRYHVPCSSDTGVCIDVPQMGPLLGTMQQKWTPEVNRRITKMDALRDPMHWSQEGWDWYIVHYIT